MIKSEVLDRARRWVKFVEEAYNDEIRYSIENSVVENNFNGAERLKGLTPRFPKTEVYLTDDTVEEAIVKAASEGKKVCVLNFASYKNPGGRFYDGSLAQEEALCHVSTLYPVLRHFRNVYEERMSRLNNGLYNEDFIYSPDVVFQMDRELYKVDVLTYAAPCMIRRPKTDEYAALFKRRIINAYAYPYLHDVDIVILGAWGCGVFCNDPVFVASMWDMCTYYLNGYYEKVIHPIPNLGKSGSRNYAAFDKHMTFNRV